MELSHVENLPQRLPIVLAAGLIAAAAIGLGDLVLGGLQAGARLGPCERLALDYGLGAGLLGVVTLSWAAGLARSLAGPHRPRRCWRSCGLVDFAGSGDAAADSKLESVAWLLRARDRPFVVVMILGSMLPAIDFDVLEYHLQGPEGVLPGRADRVPAAQRLHEHAVRRGDAPPARRWR